MFINWLALFLSYMTTAIGQVIYKLFNKTKNNFHLILSIISFGIAPFSSYIALKKLDLNLVYIGAAISQVLVLFLSGKILKEKINLDHIISIILILFGFLFISVGKK
ncbi:MAG: hypothetical protein FJW63_08810 [Actinobacteria bacterium]|nr:hypothetical protein [Actinomycetota bacterium]